MVAIQPKMVRKNSKHGVNTGNTLGLGLHLAGVRKHAVHQFAIYKYYPNLRETADQDKEIMKTLDKQLKELLNDGGMEAHAGYDMVW